MKRPIVGFHLDQATHWVADLSCGHGQHLRHEPPFTNRAWVTSPAEREEKLGEVLDCLRCDRLEMPEGFGPFKKTPEFDQETVPNGLLKNHATKAGVWAMIHVLEGKLKYYTDCLEGGELLLEPGKPGVVAAQARHRVQCIGPARFYVEFHRGKS